MCSPSAVGVPSRYNELHDEYDVKVVGLLHRRGSPCLVLRYLGRDVADRGGCSALHTPPWTGLPFPSSGDSSALAVRLAIAGQRPGVAPPTRRRLAAVDGQRRRDPCRPPRGSDTRTVPDAVVRVEHGYLLAPSAHLDADRFDELVGRARERSRDPDQRIAAVEEGLRLWTGAAYDGFDNAHRGSSTRRSGWTRCGNTRSTSASNSWWNEGWMTRSSAKWRPRRSEHQSASVSLRAACTRAVPGRATVVRSPQAIAATRRRLRGEFRPEPGRRRRPPRTPDPRPRSDAHDRSRRRRRPGRDPCRRSAAASMREGIVGDALTISGRRWSQLAPPVTGHSSPTRCSARARSGLADGARGSEPVGLDQAQAIGRALGDGRLLARGAIVRFGSGVPQDRTQAMIELGEPLDFLPNFGARTYRAAVRRSRDRHVRRSGHRRRPCPRCGTTLRTYEAVGDARSEAVWFAQRSRSSDRCTAATATQPTSSPSGQDRSLHPSTTRRSRPL